MGAAPTVSIVIPAKNEADYLPECLDSVADLDTDHEYETIVVDGDSDDRTPDVAKSFDDVTLIEGPGKSIGDGRAIGADHAEGDWLAFVDADTVLEPNYLDEMLAFVDHADLDAATSRCRMDGIRPKLMQATINRVFPHLRRPILPGFNFFVDADVYEAAGGFPNASNEDTRPVATSGGSTRPPTIRTCTSRRRAGGSTDGD